MAAAKVQVTVEFFGIPRLRAGRTEMTVAGRTILDTLVAVEKACPQLSGLISPDGRLSPHFLVSLEGRRFIRNLQEPLQTGDRIILLSADSGG